MYKLFVPLSYGDGKKEERLTNIKAVGPNTACTSTYVIANKSTNRDEIENTAKYFSTKFFNIMIGQVKVT